jgi:SAM-dependent methyltransferase
MHELVVRALRSLRRRFPRGYGAAGRSRRKLRRPALAVHRKLGRVLFERAGQDTWRLSADELAEGYLHYEPSHWTFLPRALRGERVGPRDVFVDIGCGRGRVVLQAAKRPFGRVIGVEISPEKLATARHNLAKLSGTLKCHDVELVAIDALEYELPLEATYVYLFNPCSGDAFERLSENIVASHDRRPRRLRVLYANPVEEAALERSGRFARVRLSHGLRHDHRIAIYEVMATRPSTGTAADAGALERTAREGSTTAPRS